MLGHERHRDRLVGLDECRIFLRDVDRPVKDHLVHTAGQSSLEPCSLENLFKDARYTDKYRWPNLLEIIRHFFYRFGIMHPHAVANIYVHSCPLKNMG